MAGSHRVFGAEGQARLVVEPRPPVQFRGTGLHRVAVDGAPDALVHVPPGVSQSPAPVAVMLHGAGGHAQHGIDLLRALADERGVIVVAPESRASTWDVIVDEYGPDVATLDAVLGHVFDGWAVDPERLAIGGFSDGASYALSLGITNGRLFSHVLAFSPGFSAPARREGQPRIYVSHGTRDAVLPIANCSRRIVPALQGAGYDVLYHEFDGPHTVPPDVAREAVEWFLGGGAGSTRA
jgi:predicted esterase